MEQKEQTIEAAIQAEKEKEQKFHEQSKNIMDIIVGETLARHNKLSEMDYLKRIGFGDKNISEEKASRIARFNAMQELTKGIVELNGRLNLLKETAKMFLSEEDVEFIEKEEKESENEQK